MNALTVPGLPPFDPAAALPLRLACRRGWIVGDRGQRVNPLAVQRWCKRGCQVVEGGVRYRFPGLKQRRQWMTTETWCEAWRLLVMRVRAAEARRQLEEFRASMMVWAG